jgi:hypothetical protein
MKIPDFKKLLSQKSINTYKSFPTMKPHHDWKVIIIIFISLAIILIAVSFYFWNQVRNDDLLEINKDSSAQSSLINQELMDKTMAKFKDRANKINSFPKGTVLSLDPNK